MQAKREFFSLRKLFVSDSCHNVVSSDYETPSPALSGFSTPDSANLRNKIFIDLKCIHKFNSEPIKKYDSFIHSNFGDVDVDEIGEIIGETDSKRDDFKNNYEISDLIGQGMQGSVNKLIKKSTNEIFALKRIYIQDEEMHIFVQNEIEILKILSHPNLLSFHDSFFNDKSYYIIMDYFPSISLSKYLEINPLTPPTLKTIMLQLLQTLTYLHQMNICHRDLNLKNILISFSGEKIKIIDFGVAKLLTEKNEEIFSAVGKIKTRPPEFSKKGYYTFKYDIWHVGLIFLQLLLRKKVRTKEVLKMRRGDWESLRAIVGKEEIDVIRRTLCEEEWRWEAQDVMMLDWFLDG